VIGAAKTPLGQRLHAASLQRCGVHPSRAVAPVHGGRQLLDLGCVDSAGLDTPSRGRGGSTDTGLRAVTGQPENPQPNDLIPIMEFAKLHEGVPEVLAPR
jgi:hypothetical protein